jgi:hypothetical protein
MAFILTNAVRKSNITNAPPRNKNGLKMQENKKKSRRERHTIVAFRFTSTNSPMQGEYASNCRFDGSVAVNFVSVSCRQSGNFCMGQTLVRQAKLGVFL